jgi:hypothetical protein
MSDTNKQNDGKTILTEGHQPLQKGHTAVNVSIDPKPPTGGSGVVNNSTNTTSSNSTTPNDSSGSTSSTSSSENKS